MMIDVLALDVGQTGVRSTICTAGNSVEGPELPGILASQPLLPQIAAHVVSLLDGRPATALAVGASGLGEEDSAKALAGLLGQQVTEVLIAHDSVTSYLGALGDVSGAVVAAGTGAVTLAAGPGGVRRVDGWGHLLGDEGAGFWIGREALAAVLKAHDGRGPATSLTEVARAEFGDLSGLYLVVQSDPNRVSRVAAWGRHVAEHAPSDAVSAEISQRAGAALAASVAAGLRGAGADHVASRVGNVFRNPLIASAFATELDRLVPGIQLREPVGNALLGAALLPGLAPGSPLRTVTDHYTVTA
ncbi:MAG: BadF/BadG/BcrA/BcrD ATPase family protein [Propionibacteriaceae bacterium]|nr:BadF/BadG/BcrA/BcrD ATPase family protein [Propionibacteriaceae bacterium]